MHILRSIQADLKERFGDDYHQVRKYLLLQEIILVLLLFFIYFVNTPLVLRWLWNQFQVDHPFMIFPIIVLLTIPVSIITDRRWNIRKRLKGSHYRRVSIIFSIIFFIIFMLIFWFFPPFEQTVSDAIHNFGKPVELPTQLPFEADEPNAFVDYKFQQIEITYYGNNNQLDLYIEKQPPTSWEGKSVQLDNGNEAHFQNDDNDLPHLTWQSNGLWYTLYIYENFSSDTTSKYTEADFVKVANSFQPTQ